MTLTFLHVDKTGGMTVREMLAAHYAPHEIKPVPHNPKASETHLNYPIAPPDLLLANRVFWMDHRSEYRLVMGHYDWNVVQYIDQPIILTVLREPLAWFMSLYRYICQEQAMHTDVAERARGEGPLWFARHYIGDHTNRQTAQLAGIRWTGNGMVGPDAYDAARHHLERCHYVGVTEHLDQFMADVQQGMGWDVEAMPRRNVTRYEADVTPDVAALIQERCEYDYLLYEQARARCNITPV